MLLQAGILLNELHLYESLLLDTLAISSRGCDVTVPLILQPWELSSPGSLPGNIATKQAWFEFELQCSNIMTFTLWSLNPNVTSCYFDVSHLNSQRHGSCLSVSLPTFLLPIDPEVSNNTCKPTPFTPYGCREVQAFGVRAFAGQWLWWFAIMRVVDGIAKIRHPARRDLTLTEPPLVR